MKYCFKLCYLNQNRLNTIDSIFRKNQNENEKVAPLNDCKNKSPLEGSLYIDWILIITNWIELKEKTSLQIAQYLCEYD